MLDAVLQGSVEAFSFDEKRRGTLHTSQADAEGYPPEHRPGAGLPRHR